MVVQLSTNGKPVGSAPIELTDANMTVFNDNPQAITITVDNNTKMDDTFPSPSTIASAGSAGAKVSASWIPGQSSFQVHYASGDAMTIDLGTGTYSTSSSPETFADGKSAAVLAPGPPLTTDVDYHLWFFNGPGVLPPLVNSALQANLPALIAYVNANPIKIPVNDDISLGITNIGADPSTLQCVYASMLPQTNGNGDWYVNAVMRLGQATITGNATIKGQEGDFTVGITDMMIWVQMTFDPSFQTMPQIQQLQVSLGNGTINGTIIRILEIVFPIIAALIEAGASPYRIAGAINNQMNAAIINGINSALKGAVGKNVFVSSKPSSSELHRTMPKASPAPRAINWSAWMTNQGIQATTLGQLKIPGTHDSATYQLDPVLSQVSYSSIALLWALASSTAPVNGKNPIVIPPTQSNPLYLGPALYNWVLGVAVTSVSRTEDLTILQQLQLGVRHLDLRVYYDDRDNTFYTQHALRGPKLVDLLSQIQNFLSTVAGSGELVFAYISHTNLSGNPSQISALADLVKTTISAQNLYYQSGDSVNFQTLANTTIGSITNGTPKVMFTNGDLSDNIIYPHTITNTDGYSGVPWPGDVYTVANNSSQQGPPMQASHHPLWSVAWSLDAETQAIVQMVLAALTGDQKFILQGVATNANAQVAAFFDNYGKNFNLFTCDWLEYGSTPSIPELIIGMNTFSPV